MQHRNAKALEGALIPGRERVVDSNLRAPRRVHFGHRIHASSRLAPYLLCERLFLAILDETVDPHPSRLARIVAKQRVRRRRGHGNVAIRLTASIERKNLERAGQLFAWLAKHSAGTAKLDACTQQRDKHIGLDRQLMVDCGDQRELTVAKFSNYLLILRPLRARLLRRRKPPFRACDRDINSERIPSRRDERIEIAVIFRVEPVDRLPPIVAKSWAPRRSFAQIAEPHRRRDAVERAGGRTAGRDDYRGKDAEDHS